MAWLVVGLGNPGDAYRDHRHNAGAMAVEALAGRSGERFRKVRFIPVEATDVRIGDQLVNLARSLRFMNESGPSYASLAKKRGVPIERVVAVHDDIDLAFGALRVKVGGSTAGHNGLRSLQSALGGPGFPRVRLGVGRPPGRQDPADFVLEAFSKREREGAGVLIEEGADAVISLIRDGLVATQGRYNRGSRGHESES